VTGGELPPNSQRIEQAVDVRRRIEESN